MGTELPYLVKTQICLAAFWIVYRLLFACDKAFARNRAYLLLTVAAAFVIPALSVPVWTPEATGGEPYGFRIPAEIFTGIQPETLPGTRPGGIPQGLRLFCYAGNLIMLLALSAGGFRLWRITRRATLLQPGKIRIYGLNMQGSAFTFFNRIYINELGTKPQDIAQIVAHETHHARLRHSWDILLSSVLRILFWWNPFVWLWERSLREVHEFQADDAVLNNGFDSEQYIALILGGLTVIRPEFVSGFCYSLIKKRLIMIARNKQKRRSKFRILLALPLTALLTVCFSFTERPVRQSVLTETADTEQPYSPNNGESPQRLSAVQQTSSSSATGTNGGNAIAPTSPALPPSTADEQNEKNAARPTVSKQPEQPTEISQNAREHTTDTASRTTALDRQSTDLIKQANALASRTAELNRQSAQLAHALTNNLSSEQTRSIASRMAALNRQSANLSHALANRMARFSDSTNRASSDTSIFGKPRPIILIDEKEVDNIKGLNPNDVETVSVLKDPTLVGVYGDRGKNGVILIKTKSLSKNSRVKIVEIPAVITSDRSDKPARNPEENEKPEK